MRAALVDRFCPHDNLVAEGVYCLGCGGSPREFSEPEFQPSAAVERSDTGTGDRDDRPASEPRPKSDPLAMLRDGAWLDAYRPKPMRWAVPGLVPEGLTLLAGAPKRGKSWLALDLCLAVASGGLALGTERVAQGSALYLALEDGDRRLHERVQLVNGPGPTPREFRFLTTLEARLSEVLVAYLDRYPRTRLVILDTLGRVRPAAKANGDKYQEDYRLMGALQQFALQRGFALVVVHHTRKAASDDWVDEVSGTHGLAGAADAVMVLKRARGTADGTLEVTGRDIEERTVHLKRSGPCWQVFDGNPALAERSPDLAAVVKCVDEHPEGIKPQLVAEVTGLKNATVRQYLVRALGDGLIGKTSRGVYVPVTTVTTSQGHASGSDDVTVVTGGEQ